MKLAIGDIVDYTGGFLRSCGWFTNVPQAAKVIAIEQLSAHTTLAVVEWPARYSFEDLPTKINIKNLMVRGTYDRTT